MYSVYKQSKQIRGTYSNVIDFKFQKVEPIFNGNESYEARDYLNYVGSPLEIDLKEGEISITQNNPDVWKSEENNQHPMSYCTAL